MATFETDLINPFRKKQDNIRPPFLPPGMQGKALRSDPYPRDARFRGPAASPQDFHLPRVDPPCVLAVPDPSPRAIAIEFTGRWVSLSRFCTGLEGAASVRGGVVLGSSPALGGQCAGKPWRHFSIVGTAGMKMPDKPSQCPSNVGLHDGPFEV